MNQNDQCNCTHN